MVRIVCGAVFFAPCSKDQAKFYSPILSAAQILCEAKICVLHRVPRCTALPPLGSLISIACRYVKQESGYFAAFLSVGAARKRAISS